MSPGTSGLQRFELQMQSVCFCKTKWNERLLFSVCLLVWVCQCKYFRFAVKWKVNSSKSCSMLFEQIWLMRTESLHHHRYFMLPTNDLFGQVQIVGCPNIRMTVASFSYTFSLSLSQFLFHSLHCFSLAKSIQTWHNLATATNGFFRRLCHFSLCDSQVLAFY